MIIASGDESILASHRREIVVLFCDLRGFTAFSETSEPEEVMAVLQAYHDAVGPLIHRHEGTLMPFVGDGLMVFFNDPFPCRDPAIRAVSLAVDMREAVMALASEWRRHGHEIGFGVGIAQATRLVASALSITSSIPRWEPSRILLDLRRARVAKSLSVASRGQRRPNRQLEEIGELVLKGPTWPGIDIRWWAELPR
jgi:hypothetical protein